MEAQFHFVLAGEVSLSNIVPFSLVLCAGSTATFSLKLPICSHHFQV